MWKSDDSAEYSQALRGKTRMYYFNVYEGETGTRLVITESWARKGKTGRQSLTIYHDDMTAFFAELVKALGSFEDLNRSEFLQRLGLPADEREEAECMKSDT